MDKRRSFFVATTLVVLAATVFLAFLFVNPLPSDDEMIAHFVSRRKEFELLVKQYREGNDSSTNTLQTVTGVQRISQTRTLWLPARTSQTSDHLARTDVAAFLSLKRQTSGIDLDLVDRRFFKHVFLALGKPTTVWKQYHHIPAVPRIEGGRLWDPTGPVGTSASYPHRSSFGFLFPWGWEKGECFFRRIEEHWYIKMCRAA